jgi:hypothetical protein
MGLHTELLSYELPGIQAWRSVAIEAPLGQGGLVAGLVLCIDRDGVNHQPKHRCQAKAGINTNDEWGGWGSNPRPTDYESAALTG